MCCRSLQWFGALVLISLNHIHDNRQTSLASEPQSKMASHYKTQIPVYNEALSKAVQSWDCATFTIWVHPVPSGIFKSSYTCFLSINVKDAVRFHPFLCSCLHFQLSPCIIYKVDTLCNSGQWQNSRRLLYIYPESFSWKVGDKLVVANVYLQQGNSPVSWIIKCTVVPHVSQENF